MRECLRRVRLLRPAPAGVPTIEETSKNELTAYTQTGRTAMIRWDRWKLISDAADGPQLYDLDPDPAETMDLSTDRSDILLDLLEDLAVWSMRVRDTLSEEYPV